MLNLFDSGYQTFSETATNKVSTSLNAQDTVTNATNSLCTCATLAQIIVKCCGFVYFNYSAVSSMLSSFTLQIYNIFKFILQNTFDLCHFSLLEANLSQLYLPIHHPIHHLLKRCIQQKL